MVAPDMALTISQIEQIDIWIVCKLIFELELFDQLNLTASK